MPFRRICEQQGQILPFDRRRVWIKRSRVGKAQDGASKQDCHRLEFLAMNPASKCAMVTTEDKSGDDRDNAQWLSGSVSCFHLLVRGSNPKLGARSTQPFIPSVSR
ncbi:hypothetical protein TNCV_2758871 [Trichonephila clavipes]|nr:hypothetical protein TNCV_2758871 [Trichonephila clavipes]